MGPIVKPDYGTIYDLLDDFRQRPAMYVGNAFAREPFAVFLAFLYGLRFSDINPGTPSVWGFSRWITARVKGISTSLPSDWLHENLGSEAAYHAYLRYMDEYRGCKAVRIAGLRRLKFVPRFHLIDDHGKDKSPPLPKKLFVGQFAPSKVFFLGEVYGDNVDFLFPYHRTVKGVLADATTRWSVPAAAWRWRSSDNTSVHSA